MAAKLNPEVVKLLHKKTGLKESTLRKEISNLRSTYPTATPNAIAQIIAMQREKTVWQKLTPEDKASLPHLDVKRTRHIVSAKSTKKNTKSIKTIIKYDTNDYFKRGHIDEINRAYTNKCYTSVFILTRKVIENLIVEILVNKFPATTRENKELYYDITQKRFKDFSVILKNLFDKRHEFEPKHVKTIEALYKQALKFKDEANDATHSWYHLVEKEREIDDLKIQTMIELIKNLES